MASEAKVKMVVLNPLVPGAIALGRLQAPLTSFIDVVRKLFPGEVIA
jgi:hypothetical protein